MTIEYDEDDKSQIEYVKFDSDERGKKRRKRKMENEENEERPASAEILKPMEPRGFDDSARFHGNGFYFSRRIYGLSA